MMSEPGEDIVRGMMEAGGGGLPQLRDLLIGAAGPRAAHAAQLIQLPMLFRFLNTDDKDQISTACEVLDLCFQNLSIGYVSETAGEDIVKSLQHTSSNVRVMAITELHRVICNNSNLYPLPENLTAAIEIVRCIADEELKVAIKAMEIVAFKDWLQYGPIVREFNSILESSNTSNRCRCYEVVVKIVKKSPNRIKDVDMDNILHNLIQELKTNDVLFQLNILELLSDLSVAPHGLSFLIGNNVLKSLSELVQAVDGSPIANLVVPGLMKFFGAIAYLYPTEIYDNFPSVVKALFGAINENNSAVLPTALDTLGFVGASIEGKLALGTLNRVLNEALPVIGTYIKNSPTETRVRAMSCIENIIGIKASEANAGMVDQRVTLMTKEWFRELSEKPTSMELIYGICKNPFPELRISALRVLAAVCQHQWGEELVNTTPGMMEFLLNRSVEHEKDAKHMKYEIITKLSSSSVFSESTLIRLREFTNEGPFFVQGITEVAVEGDE